MDTESVLSHTTKHGSVCGARQNDLGANLVSHNINWSAAQSSLLSLNKVQIELPTQFNMAKRKPYKVQAVGRKDRKGIVAGSLSDLKSIGAAKLGLVRRDLSVYLEDGTEVDDEEYFSSLPPETVFVLVHSEKVYEGYITDFKTTVERIFRASSVERDLVVEKIHDLINEEGSDQMYHVMAEMANQLDSNARLEDRCDDDAWFEGLSKHYSTKQDVMFSSAQGRIRKYLASAKDFFKEEKSQRGRLLAECLASFSQELKTRRFFGDYFARGAAESSRLCCREGWFSCEGPYDSAECPRRHHRINPYSSKESRVLFSTWNLDHVIEKSRAIFPAMVSAAQSCPKGYRLNWRYFFQLLFTRTNLKLVHISCHVKSEHVGHECDERRFYTKT